MDFPHLADNRTAEYMSTELKTRAVDHHLQDEEKSDDRLKNIERQIECPRCNDIMMLTPETRQLTLLLLHGTGGNEQDLMSPGRELYLRAAVLSPRGKVHC